jgi:hypothetical protein
MSTWPTPSYHPRQEFLPDRRGRRYPIHTRGLGKDCRCTGCHQKRWWTPERKRQRAVEMRRWQAEKRGGFSKPRVNVNLRRASYWPPEQVAYLKSLVGKHDLPTMAAKLTERFGYPRTEQAIKRCLQRQGVASLDVRPFTTGEVARMLGISRQTVLSRLVGNGLLVSEVWRGGQYGMHVYSRADLERLIREHAEAYEIERITDRGLRALAEAVNRGRRLVGTSEVARHVGLHHQTILNWYADGLVPSARRVHGVRPGRGGAWVIEAGDLAVVAALAHQHRAEVAR